MPRSPKVTQIEFGVSFEGFKLQTITIRRLGSTQDFETNIGTGMLVSLLHTVSVFSSGIKTAGATRARGHMLHAPDVCICKQLQVEPTFSTEPRQTLNKPKFSNNTETIL